MKSKASVDHGPEAARVGFDEADVEVEGMAEVLFGENGFAAAAGGDFPGFEDQAGGEFGQDVFDALGNEDDGEIGAGGGEVRNGAEEVLAPGDVEVDAGFVENHQLRAGHQGAGDEDFDLLSRGHGDDGAIRQMLGAQSLHVPEGEGFLFGRCVAEEADGAVEAGENDFPARPRAVAEPLVHEGADPRDALAVFDEVDVAEGFAQRLDFRAVDGPRVAHQ